MQKELFYWNRWYRCFVERDLEAYWHWRRYREKARQTAPYYTQVHLLYVYPIIIQDLKRLRFLPTSLFDSENKYDIPVVKAPGFTLYRSCNWGTSSYYCETLFWQPLCFAQIRAHSFIKFINLYKFNMVFKFLKACVVNFINPLMHWGTRYTCVLPVYI